MRFPTSSPAFALALATLASCAESDERPASWGYLHAALIVPNCATAGCHSSETAIANLAFDDADVAFDVLVGERYVVPGDVTSPLLQLLRAQERRRMPPDSPLPAADIALIERWITLGAER